MIKAVYTLDELCFITDGSHFSPEGVEYGYPMFAVKDMREYGFDYSSCKMISKEDYLLMKRNGCVPQKGDVLVAKDGSYLKEIFVQTDDKEEAILSSIAIFRPNTKLISSDYLCYLLKSPAVLNYIKDNCVSGSAIPRIVLKTFKKIKLEVPSLDIQNAIVNQLKSIDNKIKVCVEINDNLDKQMKALYSELFSKGTITKYGRLGDYCDVQKGLSYKGSGLSETEGALLVNLGNITPGGGYRKDKEKYYTGEFKQKNIVKPGDLIIANTDMTYDRIILGSPIIVPDYSGTILFTHHLFALRKLKLPQSYLYYYLRTDEFHGLCESSANGTTVLAITREDVLDAPIPIPDKSAIETFDKNASAALKTMSENEKESANLMALRDYLLPKLMSGEIDVSTLEIPN